MVNVRIVVVSLALSGACFYLQAQVTEKPAPSEKSAESRALDLLLSKQGTAAETGRPIPMEGPINPDTYIMGPSDQISIALSGPMPLSYSLFVTPEGTLIIPTVGELRLDGLTLTEAKQKVKEAVKKKYLLSEVSVTLVTTRSILVTLRGAVLRPGQYVASPLDRVEKVLLMGSSSAAPAATATILPTVPESVDQIPLKDAIDLPKVNQAASIYDGSSTRNITLIRKGKDTLHVDIPKFYVTGQDRYNPVLLDGDAIVVPQRRLSREFVAVYGAVNAPGRYEFAEGDSLRGIIALAQGLTKGADPENIRISRLSEDGETMQDWTVSLKAIQNGTTPDLQITRGDRIVVGTVPSERKNFIVTVAGEVRQQGIYPITKGSTRLSKVLRDAGGLTENALPQASVVMRKDDRMLDLFDPQVALSRNLRAQLIMPPDSSFFLLDLRAGRHPVVMDMAKLIERHDSTQDIILRPDDVVYVASNSKCVLVQGQVANPGYIPFVAGASLAYYIQKAGGFAEMAIASDTRIIKRGTLEWVEPSKTTIEVGDQIWVPKEKRRDFDYYFGVASNIASITAALATTVLLAIRIFQP